MTRRKRRRAPGTEQAPPVQARVRGRPALSGPRAVRGFIIGLVALAVLPYANSLRNGFVLDDIPIVLENPLVRDVGSVGAIFGSNYWDRGGAVVVGDSTLYRPLTVFTYAVDYALWKQNPTGFHATNILLHAAVTVMLFLIAVEVLASPVAAFVSAAIFAVHPVHTEAVTGIVGRAEVLAALFYLAAFVTLRRRSAFDGAAAGASRLRVLAVAAGGASLYLLGLFSKEIAVTLPAVLALDDWLHREELPRDRRAAITVLAMRYGALAVASAVYFGFRQNAVSGGSSIWPGFAGVAADDRILTASRVLLEYVGLFVFPRTLLADYWKTDVLIARSLAEPMVLVSIVLWVALAAFLVRRFRRDPPLVLSIGWFLITILPVSNLLFPIGVAKAERLLYLPSAGLCLVAGLAYARAEGVVRVRGVPRVALAAMLVALTARTIVRNTDWRDSLTLALATLEKSTSPLMNDIAAGELVKRGELARATEHLREAVRQSPDMRLIRVHLGVTLHQQGLLDQAIAEYKEAIRRHPDDAEAHNNLGAVYLDQQREAEAVAEFTEAVRLHPRYADPRMNLGVIHLARGRYAEAVTELTAAVQADPFRAETRNALGVAYARLGQIDRAAAEYNEALRLKPDYAAARENLARLSRGTSTP